MLCADMIHIQWKPPKGRQQRATALLDISPSGPCLQMEFEVPVGSEIHWKSPNQEFAGGVRYGPYREIGYFVNVEDAPVPQVVPVGVPVGFPQAIRSLKLAVLCRASGWDYEGYGFRSAVNHRLQ